MENDDLLTKIMERNLIKSSGIALKDHLHFAGALIGGTAGGVRKYSDPNSTATDVVRHTTLGALLGTGAVAGAKALAKGAPRAVSGLGQFGKDLKEVKALRKRKAGPGIMP